MSLLELEAVISTREGLEGLLAEHRSIRGMLLSFNLRPHPFYYDKVRDSAYRHGVRITSANNKRNRGKILAKNSMDKHNLEIKGKFSVDKDVKEAVAGAKSYREALTKLGVQTCGVNYKKLTLACSRLGIEPPTLGVYNDKSGINRKKAAVRYRYNLDVDALVKAAKEKKTVTLALQEQNILKPSTQLRIRAAKLVIEQGFSFPANRNAINGYKTPKKDINLYLIKNSVPLSSGMKKRLVEEGLLTNKCSLCKIKPIWQGALLVLQLDHINGDPTDNRLSNLRLLCPNCHSQTKTFVNNVRK